MPVQPKGIEKIEKLQMDYLKKIPYLRKMNYWEILSNMKMLSLQRRQERYRVIYVWKVLEGLVPNCGINVIPNSENARLGRRFPISSASSKLRTQTFQDHGPKLFNSLPAKLRNLTDAHLINSKWSLTFICQQYQMSQNWMDWFHQLRGGIVVTLTHLLTRQGGAR